MRVKQSLCIPIFRPENLDAFLAGVKEIGFPAVEIWGRGDDFEDTMKLVEKHGLVMASMGGHGAKPGGLNDPAEHERIEAELRESIELAADRGVPNLICLSGNVRDGVSREDMIDACAECLKRVAEQAEARAINLNVELLNSKVNHPGYFLDRTDIGVAVVDKVGSPRVKLLYDIYHMQIMEGDVIRTIREQIGKIGHFHTAGNPGRQDLDEEQELNYRAICETIAATDYDGFVAHEFKPKGDALVGLRQAFEICDVG